MAICDQCGDKVKKVDRQKIGNKVIYQMCESCCESVVEEERKQTLIIERQGAK